MKKRILASIGSFIINCIIEFNHSKVVPVNADIQDVFPCGDIQDDAMELFVMTHGVDPDELTAHGKFLNPSIQRSFNIFQTGFNHGKDSIAERFR